MNPKYFSTKEEFRKWLEENHKTETELFVGFYKKGTGKPSMDWSESVDQALCFGWIDGVRRRIDDESYCNRFTPRRPTSGWSRINIKKMEDLQKSGEMTPAGLAVFNARNKSKDESYSYESGFPELSVDLEKEFKANNDAWEFFQKQPPSYRKPRIHWINSAKQEETRISRLRKLIKLSGEGKRM